MPVMSEGDSTVNVSGLSYDHAENDTSKRTIILTYINNSYLYYTIYLLLRQL